MIQFDPNTPTYLQRNPWTCAIGSVIWALRSIGIPVEPGEAQDAMSPRYVRPDVGLLDATGAGIVEVLRDHWGVEAANDGAATFDEVAALAGSQPVLIGLRNWGGPGLGHWSAVWGFDGARLLLANPGGTGPVYGQQSLTRQEFDSRGPASMVSVSATTNETPKAEVLRGIDVASHQGAADWPAVAASGVAFAFTKATGGTWYRNPTFAPNWLGIKAAGLVRGAYHYAFELSGDAWPGSGPEAEAAYFVAELKRGGGIEAGDLLALDIEDGNGPLGDWCLRWCREVERLTGVRPMIYTGAWFSVPHGLGAVPQLADYKLWLAAYQATMPAAPPPWTDVTIWQHSATGRVPGISGNVDLNVFDGTREQLLALGKPGAGEPSTFSVGEGLRAAMRARNDEPASDEVFTKHDGRDAWSEAFGASGARYVWVGGRVVRFDPSA